MHNTVKTVGTAQFAGGVPAMCDGVTQGEPGMELSLVSRDVIAMSTVIGLSHNVFDGGLRQGHARNAHGCPPVRSPAHDLYPGRAHDLRPKPTRERRGPVNALSREKLTAARCWPPRSAPTTVPAPAPARRLLCQCRDKIT